MQDTEGAATTVDHNGLEVLDGAECVRLLESRSVGRLGITDRALPTILPVSYAVVDGRVLVRTGSGSRLDAAARNAVVAFEVDDIDEGQGTGWSVVVTGMATEQYEPTLDDQVAARLDRWVPGRDGRLVAIPLDRVSGRRVRPRPTSAGGS